MHVRQCSKLLTYPAVHHSSSSSVGRRLLVTSYGYWGWDKGWIVYGMEALVKGVKVMCARSGSCACVYIGCACVLYMCVLCGYVCQCGVCTRMGTRGWHQASSPFLLLHPIFWDSLSLSLELINSTSCLAGELQGSACLCSLRPGVPRCLCGAGGPILMLAQKSLYPLSHLSSSYWHSCALETALPTCVSCTRRHAPICVCLRVSWMFVTCSPRCLRSCWAAVGVTWCPGVIFRVVLESR